MKRKTKARPTTTRTLDLPAPRPLIGLERELYELLVSDLEACVDSRLKGERRKSKVVAELATQAVREEKLRAQLVQFEPELDGLGVVLSQFGQQAPPAQPSAPQ